MSLLFRSFLASIWVLLVLGCSPQEDVPSGKSLTAESDRLRVEYRGQADLVKFQMFQGISQELEEVEPGLFATDIELPGAEGAVFSYDLIAQQTDSTGRMVRVGEVPANGRPPFQFIGPDREFEFPEETGMVGEVVNKVISSTNLGADRALTIYKPPSVSSSTPIFYCTDGGTIKTLSVFVDAMIQADRIQPIMLVGVHANSGNRYEEYVNNGIPNELFPKHESFFLEEVIPQIEAEIPEWQGDRYLYGVSNGAAFCMYMGINYPDLFSEVVAFSTADYITEMIRPVEFKFEQYPSFYLGAGRYEDSFFRDNKRFAEKMASRDIELEWKEFVSGHDFFTWRYEFLEYLEHTFN